jgi:molybdate transport system ATP-binding protein
MGLVKYLLSLINGDNTKGYGQDLYLFVCEKGSGENIWDIKKTLATFQTAMTDLFQKNDSLEQMVLSGFFDSIGVHNPPYHKKNSFSMAKTSFKSP